MLDGFGMHTFGNGNCYEGQWKDSKKHGQGKDKFKNGDSYVGEYKNGKYHGFG